MFGSPETTPGGRALKFYSSCRVDVRKLAVLKDGENMIGIRMKVKIVKNKVAPPFRVAEFDMLGDRGISLEGDVLDMAATYNVVDRSGSWYVYGATKLGQGREKARTYLEEHPEIVAELREKVMASFFANGQKLIGGGED
jgi:recombination protein RecA